MRAKSGHTLGLFGLACASSLLVASCSSNTLSPGDHVDYRITGVIKGDFPLRLLPPISDRDGNIYTLYGQIDIPEVLAFLSKAQGGSSALCNFTKGDVYGAHGWVGFAQNRVWYWAGDALVGMTGDGGCFPILDTDPGTNSSIAFRAVLPWVRDAPSQTTLVALVQAPTDTSPFVALVDLNNILFTDVRAFDPPDATAVKVIGVGADRVAGYGVVVLEYTSGGGDHLEARFYDEAANETGRVPIAGGPLPAYGVAGYLQIGAAGVIVGLVPASNGQPPQLITFDRKAGVVNPLNVPFDPVGVHEWNGGLWLVGRGNAQPVIAGIDKNGAVGGPIPWNASLRATSLLAGPQSVIDDRTSPNRRTTWAVAKEQAGDFAFLTAHSPWLHASGTTITAIGGPQYQSNGGTMTFFAIAPTGIAYP